MPAKRVLREIQLGRNARDVVRGNVGSERSREVQDVCSKMVLCLRELRIGHRTICATKVHCAR